MSLSTWEQQALDSIRDGLADSDPKLAARLAIFTRLASGEEMPVREKIHNASRRLARRRRARARRSRRPYRRLGVTHVMLLVWLVATSALIAVALGSNRGGGHGTCAGPWVATCNGTTAAAKPGTPIP